MSTAAFTMRGGAAGESELFTWPFAQLLLVHNKEQALLQRGAFTLLLAHHSRSAHLVAVEASVGEVRWPVGKDCLVTSFAGSAHSSSCFLFALRLPASHDQLTYQLLLFDRDHSTCQTSRLQALLALYATLHVQPLPTNSGSAKSSLKELEEAAGKYWAGRVYDKQAEIRKQEAGTFKKQGEKVWALSDSCQSSHGSSVTNMLCAGISKRMMKRMHKARRVSAVSKLFSKAVVRGLINAKAHVVHEAAGSSNDDQQITSTHAGIKGNSIKPVVANVDAITKVVEAVEGSLPQGMKCSANAASLGCKTVLDNSALSTTWTINEQGLRLILNVAMAAYNMQAASTGAVAKYSASSSRLLTAFNSISMSKFTNASTAKAVGETVCGALSCSSSQLSSLQSSSTNLATTSSTRRPPRPPHRVDALLHEVSSPVSVNSNSHIVK